MARPAFKILGIDDVKKAFQKLPPKIAKQVVRKSLREGVKVLQKDLLKRVPVGKTKHLKKAVKVRARKRSRKVIAVNLLIGKGDFKGPTYYGAMVDMGTKKQEGQQFMEATYAAKGDQAMRLTRESILKGILESAKSKGKLRK